jgi:hypothetical protein
MNKERHKKVKLSARVSEEALNSLEWFRQKLGFPSTSEALEYLLLEFSNTLDWDEENEVLGRLRTFQAKHDIKDMAEALSRYYESEEYKRDEQQEKERHIKDSIAAAEKTDPAFASWLKNHYGMTV